jgi:amino acid adenylation domain-containing protein/non-ribosomal peptide synthase protein (TIGR01720 family)
VSYGELNRRANQLAHYLRRQGVAPDARVGICVERGVEMVVGLLGVLKAGGGYVPLDPAYPAERLKYVLQDSAPVVLLTQKHLREQMGGVSESVRVIDLEEDEAEWSKERESNPERSSIGLRPEHLAYVIYTSGSTGSPKGVMVEHRNVTRLFAATSHWFEFGANDTWTLFHSYGFDFSVWEIWGALIYGGRLVVVPKDIARSPEDFYKLICQKKVTVLNQTPSAFRQLVMAQKAANQEHQLRYVIFGGEALEVSTLRPWYEQNPDGKAQLVNMYGITETTVHVTYRALQQVDAQRTGWSPIGCRIPDLRTYILDSEREPVPVGVVGELFIGGAGVARGYLNQPELTAERFVNDPFVGDVEARMYRTGDLGRWLADGSIEFIGRNDFQVKVRGFRIELGEIEARLAEHEQVREAVVVVQEDGNGEKRLVAYVVTEFEPDAGELAGRLRAYLASTLPEYMVPAAYVRLEKMPLTPNGKLDRKALPDPDKVRMEVGQKFQAPRTQVEKMLCEIWEKVLGLNRVGVKDNFFEVGGDSILCVQIVARAREAGLQMTVQQMFRYQTVAELAVQVQTVVTESYGSPARLTGKVPLTPIQSWFFERQLPSPSHYNQSVMLKVPVDIDEEVVEAALCELLKHHDVFRLKFSKQAEGKWQQEYAEDQGEAPILQRFDFSRNREKDRRELLEAEANRLQASLELEKPPLLRAVWFNLGGEERRLLLVVHHLIVDGVSWRILLGDLQALCQQVRANEPLCLPYQSASFGQWAWALAEHCQSEAMKGEVEYWQQVASHAASPLPRDLDAIANTMASTAFVQLQLSAEETQALLQQVPRTYHTQIQDVLVTALARGFEHWTGSQGLLLELEGHGREELPTVIDVSRTVGWFTTLFPAYVQLPGTGPGEDLKAVKEQLRGIPRHGIGFGMLYYLNRELRSSVKATPEVVFNYLGQFDRVLSEDRWQAAPESAGARHNATQERAYLLEINAHIAGGRLHFSFAYNRNIHREETIQRLAADCLAELQALIAHCCAAESSFTPSDFPLARLTQQELDRISQGRKLEDVYPLSPMQEGILFHTIEASNSGVYMHQFCVELEGAWGEVELLRQAWEQVMKRHEVLRTSFVWEGLSRPLQRVEHAPELPWDVKDCRGLSRGEQLNKLNEYLKENRTRSFVLEQAPLMRIGLIRTGEDRFYLAWTHHHLVLDGWSVPRVLGEVLQFYDAAGQELQLPEPRPFRDYISWLQRQDLHSAEDFWREMLRDFSTPTQLGIERRHSAGQITSVRFGRKQIYLERKLREELEALAQKQRLTLNTLMQAAWGLLLSHYSGQPDVVFGATTAARPVDLPGVEQITGLFINTLPVRLCVQDQDSVLDCLHRLQQQQIEARRYEYTPLVRIQRCSEVPPGKPLFQSILVFENYPAVRTAARPQTGRMRVLTTFAEESSNYPLTAIVLLADSLVLHLAYDSDLFDAAIAERLLEHWQQLLREMAANPEHPALFLEMLDEAEKRQALTGWNNTQYEWPQGSIHDFIQDQAAKRPDALAVIDGTESWRYEELNHRANQWAYYLIAEGVKPGMRIGVCLDGSLEWLVVCLGVLKSGGVLVGLEPEEPWSRMAVMLKNSDVGMIITDSVMIGNLTSLAMKVLNVDERRTNVTEASKQDLQISLTGESPGVVLYRSGAAGEPLGVLIKQSGLWGGGFHNGTVEMKAEGCERVAQQWGFTSEAASFEVFRTLARGGCAINIPRKLAQTPRKLAESLRNQRVTVWWAEAKKVELMGQEFPWALNKVQEILCEEEPAMVVRLRERLPERVRERLYGVYGYSEAAGSCIKYQPGGTPEENTVRVAQAAAGMSMYVLDRARQPVPIGVPGELYIGGIGVACGYWDRPDLTAEKFVLAPRGGKEGARLYRTGDRARFLADGNLKFLGRIDLQVRIRGYRIEPAEVEAVLSVYPGVHRAMVVAREDVPGQKRLAGYVAAPGGEVEAKALQQFLRDRLPEYMVPSAWVIMDELPVRGNGKIDPQDLPRPEMAGDANKYCAPRTEVEKKLAEIWEKLLGARQVGLHDNFFALGGHSLLVVQLMVEVQRLFGINISLRDVFMAPTLAELAAALKRGDLGTRNKNLIPVRPAGTQTPLFLVHALGGGVDYVADLAPFINADIPIYGLQATGFAPGEEPLTTIEEMAELYVDNIRELQPHGPYRVAGWSSGGTIAYEMARRLMERGAQVEFLGLLDTNYSDRTTMDSENASPKDFDANFELIDVLSLMLDKEDLDDVIQMAQTYDFETLIERSSHIMDKIAKQYPSVHTLDISALRRILRIRHATANAVLNYYLVSCSMPVCLFEARDAARPSGAAWRRLLGDYLQVVPVQGTHHTMTSSENLKSLGAAITDTLAKDSVQIASFPAPDSFTRSAAEV